jgi:LAO/AO transport system kinase
MTASALHEQGLAAVWDQIAELAAWRQDHGHWAARRAAQARHWFGQEVREALLARLETPLTRARMADLAEQVAEGRLAAAVAAQTLLAGLDG